MCELQQELRGETFPTRGDGKQSAYTNFIFRLFLRSVVPSSAAVAGVSLTKALMAEQPQAPQKNFRLLLHGRQEDVEGLDLQV